MSHGFKSSLLPQDPREKAAVLAVAVAALLLFGGDLRHWFNSTIQNLRSELREHVPLELEIERARDMAASLTPDLRRNHAIIVREQVETEELRLEIQEARDRLLHRQSDLRAWRERLIMLSDARAVTLHTDEVDTTRRGLREAFEAVQTAEAMLKSREEIRQQREQTLRQENAAQNALLTRKEVLEAQLEELTLRLGVLQRDAASDMVRVDQETLGRCSELISHLRRRLTIAERIAAFPETNGRTPAADSTDEDDIVMLEAEVDRYLDVRKGVDQSGAQAAVRD